MVRRDPKDSDKPFDAQLADLYRQESGRCVATLVRVLGDVDLAEDAVADAFALATTHWAQFGVPPNPGAWIITTARNRAIDHLRRESTRAGRQQAAWLLTDDSGTTVTPDLGTLDAVPDDQLRLIFLCCHPAIAPDSQVALTLRLLGGLETAEIAAAFLVPESTMAQRLVRAKRKIRDNHIAYRIPDGAELLVRLQPVLAVLYLVFNAGHTANSGDALTRPELTTEAIRVARLLVDLLPDEPEPQGLLALMLLTESRRNARTGRDGDLVRLADQDRTLWDRALIAEGHELVRACLRRNSPGTYQFQAAIAAVHADASEAQDTDWAQIVALYDQLHRLRPNDVVALNRAIAVAELRGPDAGLQAVSELRLHTYHLFHATRAELLARCGRIPAAIEAYDRAIELTTNDVERQHLVERRAALQPPTVQCHGGIN